MGARAYRLLSLYEPVPGALVEVGAERGEGSTAFLYRYAKEHGLRFYSADIDPTEEAERAAPGRIRKVTGSVLLRRLRTPISVAYLDGFDWIPEGSENEKWIARQRHRYRELGIELDNEACQREHLEEAHQIARNAAERCLVILDDTFQTEEGWSGKGGKAVPYLEIERFRVIFDEGASETSLGFAVVRRG